MSSSSTAAYCPARPIWRRTCRASAPTSYPATRACRRPAAAAWPGCARSWSCPRRSGRAARGSCRAPRADRGRRARGWPRRIWSVRSLRRPRQRSCAGPSVYVLLCTTYIIWFTVYTVMRWTSTRTGRTEAAAGRGPGRGRAVPRAGAAVGAAERAAQGAQAGAEPGAGGGRRGRGGRDRGARRGDDEPGGRAARVHHDVALPLRGEQGGAARPHDRPRDRPPVGGRHRGADWRERLERWAWEMLEVYRRHPWMTEIPVDHLPVSPNQLTWMETGLQCFTGTGLAPAERLALVMLVNGYVRSQAELVGNLRWARREEGVTEAEMLSRDGRLLARGLDPGRFPASTRWRSPGRSKAPSSPPTPTRRTARSGRAPSRTSTSACSAARRRGGLPAGPRRLGRGPSLRPRHEARPAGVRPAGARGARATGRAGTRAPEAACGRLRHAPSLRASPPRRGRPARAGCCRVQHPRQGPGLPGEQPGRRPRRSTGSARWATIPRAGAGAERRRGAARGDRRQGGEHHAQRGADRPGADPRGDHRPGRRRRDRRGERVVTDGAAAAERIARECT